MNYVLTLQRPDGGETTMSLSDQSPGPQTAGGGRMTGAALKAAVDAGETVCVRIFDNDSGYCVMSVVEEA